MNVLTHTLPITLQQARKARRLSQLELALRVGVSQRHVSFVESGRAKPSRTLLMSWLQELNAPLGVRNAAMLQAGYAPAFSAAALTDPLLAQANDGLVHLLQAHDPMPAFVMDALWNVLHFNKGGKWLAGLLMPWAADVLAAAATANINMLDMLAHPQGFTRHILNLNEGRICTAAGQIRPRPCLQHDLTHRSASWRFSACFQPSARRRTSRWHRYG